jgi:hypothetical protein
MTDSPAVSSSELRRRPRGVVVAVVVAALLAGAAALLAGRALPGWEKLEPELRDRGDVLFVGGDDLERLASGTTRVRRPAQVPGVSAALAGRDGWVLSDALRTAGIARLVVDARGALAGTSASAPLAERLRALAHVDGLAARMLSPVAGIYDVVEPHGVPPNIGDAMARVARELLVGARPPRIGSFPEVVRRARPAAEVLLIVREGGRAKLWRSARSATIARGLLTAAQAARARWGEREQALGGPIESALARCDVELALLEEDGTVSEGASPFVDRVVTPLHGVGYERRGAWRYHLPEQVHARARTTGTQAFGALFDEHGVARAEGFALRNVRLYRLVVTRLGRSGAPATSALEAPAADSRAVP